MSEVLDMVWAKLQAELDSIRSQVALTGTRTERAETACGVGETTYANLPYAVNGAGKGDLFFVTNGRKVGEGVGAGTGTLCYYNSTDNTWRRCGDDTAVAI